MEPMSLFLSPAQTVASLLPVRGGQDPPVRPLPAPAGGAGRGHHRPLAAATTNTAVYGVTDTWTTRTICALLFPFGLAMVVLMGAELFHRQLSHHHLPAGPAVLFGGNASELGAGVPGQHRRGGAHRSGLRPLWTDDYSSGLLGAYTIKVAAGKCALSAPNALVLGILCNLLVCLGVMMALSGRDNVSRILGAYLPVCFFVLCGFEHSIANLYYIPAGPVRRPEPRLPRSWLNRLCRWTCRSSPERVSEEPPGCHPGQYRRGAGLGALLWTCFRPRAGQSGLTDPSDPEKASGRLIVPGLFVFVSDNAQKRGGGRPPPRRSAGHFFLIEPVAVFRAALALVQGVVRPLQHTLHRLSPPDGGAADGDARPKDLSLARLIQTAQQALGQTPGLVLPSDAAAQQAELVAPPGGRPCLPPALRLPAPWATCFRPRCRSCGRRYRSPA